MKRHFVVFLLILITPTVTAADKWDVIDLALLTTASAAIATDWAQTRTIARTPERFGEINPILGYHPSTGDVDKYFAGLTLGTAIIAHWLPGKYRKTWLGATTVVEVGFAAHNYFSMNVRADW